MARHPNVGTILRYFEGCNSASIETMTSTFVPDVVHYFIDRAPVRGADQVAQVNAKLHAENAMRWSVDRAIAQGDEAAIEWSATWIPFGEKDPEVMRGAEWYVFRERRIAEIRAYHQGRYLRPGDVWELRGFPYGDRGYSTAKL